MISEKRCGEALTHLAETDDKAAELKAEVSRSEYRCKLARARVFLASEGSVEAKKATAECSPEVQAAEDLLASAIVAFEKIKAERATEELIVEVWRTCSANQRKGNI